MTDKQKFKNLFDSVGIDYTEEGDKLCIKVEVDRAYREVCFQFIVDEPKDKFSEIHVYDLEMPRKIQYYKDKSDAVHNYMLRGERCSCGSNVYHLEYDEANNIVYGVCNGCNHDIYTMKDEYIKETLAEGIWKNCDNNNDEQDITS